MLELFLRSTLIILCLLVIYHHVIFPVILKFYQKSKQNSHHGSVKDIHIAADDLPYTTLIIPVFNEGKNIQQKILNTASLIYPDHKLKVIIACDGCTDDTVFKAYQALTYPEVKSLSIQILDFPTNRGKVAVLNDVIGRLDTPIIAFSDCSAILSLDALYKTAKGFLDKNVAVVGGGYYFADADTSSESIYWSYQRNVKKGEAAFGAPMGLHGAFYAIRRELASPMPQNTINDDFILPMKIVADGYRAIYDENIKCVETENSTTTMNWKRRVRISAGNIQQAIECIRLLSLKHPGIAFCFFSGKFLRAWMPLILVAIITISSLGALFHPFYLIFLTCQFIGLALAFLPTSNNGKIAKIIETLRYLTVGYIAGFVGTVRYFIGQENGSWKRVSE